ncbi:MAG: hypothetical protein A3B90_02290 [Candidatus Magasanikbacteria bacterium RIFCSPHIGHO2_02_FULL_41_13]|uniref:Uncharacterized protein n=1 Tax=Candidatus Magasanikbacteria bacterium RIFCSPHIGHO2_02_FULL_41_13 TaxID=1798676 RepID=A0A1F6M3X9_9BACT|nr:MAG: hypothetical protein A3B90_02290 [Candidatus Magasanikbacteria bacterium RIFCSPHIGHO2_02_FULL_41_13]
MSFRVELNPPIEAIENGDSSGNQNHEFRVLGSFLKGQPQRVQIARQRVDRSRENDHEPVDKQRIEQEPKYSVLHTGLTFPAPSKNTFS